MTNADKIRQMSDEELAFLLDRELMACANNECGSGSGTHIKCMNCLLDWLKQEVSEC